jgi:hypothetical protein
MPSRSGPPSPTAGRPTQTSPGKPDTASTTAAAGRAWRPTGSDTRIRAQAASPSDARGPGITSPPRR